jgi:hypothetical protein
MRYPRRFDPIGLVFAIPILLIIEALRGGWIDWLVGWGWWTP